MAIGIVDVSFENVYLLCMDPSVPFRFGSVLIVDDSEIDVLVNRRLMELTRFAGNVIIARNGEEALDYLKSECKSPQEVPDWIFLDMHLPGMGGVEFIEAMKELPAYFRVRTRVVILSVLQNPAVLDEILKLEFVHGRMDKPLTQQALLELVGLAATHVSF